MNVILGIVTARFDSWWVRDANTHGHTSHSVDDVTSRRPFPSIAFAFTPTRRSSRRSHHPRDLQRHGAGGKEASICVVQMKTAHLLE